MIIKLDQNKSEEITKQAVKVVQNGGLVVLPFDTVYGIICDPKNNQAIEKIFSLKNRPQTQTIGLASDSFETITQNIEISPQNQTIMRQNLPGKVSFVLPVNDDARFSSFCIRNKTILIRVPDSQLVQDIARFSGGFIAQTSMNKNGQPSCKNFDEIQEQFGNELNNIDFIIVGEEIVSSKPSTIINLTDNQRIVRE